MPSHEIFEKYPLVQKAYQEQEGIAAFLQDTVPESYTAMIERTTAIAEEFLDGTPEEKEAVMVGCILATASSFTFDDIRRFETEYTPQVKELVDDLVKNTRPIEKSPFLQQINAVLSVFSFEQMILSDIGDAKDNAIITDSGFRESILEVLPLLEETAPRLHAFLNKKMDEMVATAQAHNQAAAKQNSGVKGSSGPGMS